MPTPSNVYRVDGTVPDGSGSVTVTLPDTVVPDNTWVNFTFRPTPAADLVDDSHCAWEFHPTDNDKIVVKRGSTLGAVDFHLQVVEFDSGVSTQRGSFLFEGVGARHELFLPTPVDKSSAFVQVWVTVSYSGGDTGWEGIRGYMVRAQIQDGGEEVWFERNEGAIGFNDNEHDYTVYWQVVEIDNAFVQHGDQSHSFGTTQWETGEPVDLGKAFIIASYRSTLGGAGGARADEVTDDNFMFGGTGMANVGSLGGLGHHAWWQLVEVPDWYVEAAPIEEPAPGVEGPGSHDAPLKAITDPANTIAVFPFGVRMYVDGGLDSNGKGSAMSGTVEIVDANTLRYKTNYDKYAIDGTPFAIQMTPLGGTVTEDVVLKNLQKKEFTLPGTEVDVTIDPVDMSKTICWATAREDSTNTTKACYVTELTSPTNVKVQRRTNANTATIILYVVEFESGVEVRRQWINGDDDILGDRKTVRTEFAEYSKSFLLVQHMDVDPNWSPSVAYTGSTVIRCMGPHTGTGIQADVDHTFVQVVTLKDDSAVQQVTVAVPDGVTEKETTGLSHSFPANRRFMWFTRQFAGNEANALFEGEFTSPTSFKLTRYVGNNNRWVQVFLIDTQNIVTEQASYEMLNGVGQVDVSLLNNFNLDQSAVLLPYQGYFGRSGEFPGSRHTRAMNTMELTDPATVQLRRTDSDLDARGTFFVLGFQTTVPNPCSVDPAYGDCEEGIPVAYPDCEEGIGVAYPDCDEGITADFSKC